MSALLLDTYSLFFRAFHALPPMNTLDGTPTNAVYGFSVLLIKLLREHVPGGVAFALDAPATTERRRAVPSYKANRGPVPDALRSQFPLLQRLIAALGFPAWQAPGFEADDVLATLARRLSEQGQDVLCVSGDRDLLQVVRERTHVLFVGRRGGAPERYDRAAVLARFGIPPERLPAYVALVGDPSDNIPKLPGIGPRTAGALIATHASAAELLEHIDELDSPRLRQTLAEHREQLLQNEALVRLRDDLELGAGDRYTAPLTEPALDRTRALFAELEFKSLLPRLDALVADCALEATSERSEPRGE